ncbi:MAG: GFA family protein [Gammaproteobacteria bacterium]|nr:GFA family protein [Gammaproteobacteria bacterium]MBV9619935.1 GFA family protein [Gammaproteobacteria bacterium]
MPLTGGCLCAAVRYRVEAEPIVTRVCWCRVCQYLGAGSGTVNVCFPSAALTVSGSMGEHRWRADSGNIAVRRFCSVCGTPLFSASEARPHLIFVRAGSLDDPGVAKPAVTIWTASAPAWACFDPALPRLSGQPPPAA